MFLESKGRTSFTESTGYMVLGILEEGNMLQGHKGTCDQQTDMWFHGHGGVGRPGEKPLAGLREAKLSQENSF